MALVVCGIDALDPELVSTNEHPHLTLRDHRSIETISSSKGKPSTHELWPTIITGLPPEKHGLTLDDGVTWENPVLRVGSRIANHLLTDNLRTRIGARLLNRTTEDQFRIPASYYEKNGVNTLFENVTTKTIGIPNYVTDPDTEDREHQLRRNMGELFKRDPDAKGGHVSTNPNEFYEQCLEMVMVRIARIRRALRGRQYELVFGYTSGLDLIGHVSYDRADLQAKAYQEMNDFIGELRDDLGPNDELVLISDHGLQDGIHTEKAMIASTDPNLINSVTSVLDVRNALEQELDRNNHSPEAVSSEKSRGDASNVQEHLEDLGYI